MTPADLLDDAVALVLILGLPAAFTLRPSKQRTARSRYLSTTIIVGALMAILLVDWLITRRSADLLGLSWPPRTAGLVGLGLAAVIVPGVLVAARRITPPSDAAAVDRVLSLLPQGRRDWLALSLFVLIGLAGAEILYRGFLMWWLAPRIGLAGAVAVAALAYAGAHGFRDVKSLVASFGAALAFTIAYVATGSLWWLMILHGAAPFAGIASAARLRPQTA